MFNDDGDTSTSSTSNSVSHKLADVQHLTQHKGVALFSQGALHKMLTELNIITARRVELDSQLQELEQKTKEVQAQRESLDLYAQELEEKNLPRMLANWEALQEALGDTIVPLSVCEIVFAYACPLAKPLEARALLIGLDGSGKTALLSKLANKPFETTVPTIGFNKETIDLGDAIVEVWELGGQAQIRPLWLFYYENVDVLVFVVDASNTSRVDESLSVLSDVLGSPALRQKPLLVLANKQDEEGALLPQVLADMINSKLTLLLCDRCFRCEGATVFGPDGSVRNALECLVQTPA